MKPSHRRWVAATVTVVAAIVFAVPTLSQYQRNSDDRGRFEQGHRGYGYNYRHRRYKRHRRGGGDTALPAGFGPALEQGERVTTADMADMDPLIPSDIYRTSPTQSPDEEDLATFAWLEFIALNSIAGDRGVPDDSFETAGAVTNFTLVWETYLHRAELFPFNAAGAVPPQDWNSSPLYVYGIPAGPGGARVPYTSSSGHFNNLDETSQIGQNTLFFPTASEGSQVLFEAKVNQVEWQFVLDNYNGALSSHQTDPASGTLFFNPSIDLPDNVVEVKAAWRPLSSIPANRRYRYHTSEVIYYTGDASNPQPVIDNYALIGLHIIHKTSNYPTFIFATFEHVDNVALEDTGQPSGLYYVPVYTSISYTTSGSTLLPSGETAPNPTINFNTGQPIARPNFARVTLPMGPVQNIPGAQPDSDGIHVQVPVVQPPTTSGAVAEINRQVLSEMQNLVVYNNEFIWQYYKLKGVQSVPTSVDSAEGFYLANNVIESSQPGIQVFQGGVSFTPGGPLVNARNQANVQDPMQNNAYFSMGGCQGCHGVAQTRNGLDFSFLFFGVDGIGFEPDTVGAADSATEVRRAQNYDGQLRR